MALLSFGRRNAKLGKMLTFSLPAGYSCPSALHCLSKANKVSGKITDGKETKFRCFAASGEALFPNVRKSRWKNYDLLRKRKNSEEMANLIERSVKKFPAMIRIHVSGDHYSQEYFDSWLIVALHHPETIFYFYTKQIPLWLERINLIGNGHKPGLLRNVVPTASYGGKHDNLIAANGLRSATVVYSETSSLKLDHDDSFAMKHGPSFGLLIHNQQPKGSEAMKAVQALRNKGEYGYGEAANRRRELVVV